MPDRAELLQAERAKLLAAEHRALASVLPTSADEYGGALEARLSFDRQHPEIRLKEIAELKARLASQEQGRG